MDYRGDCSMSECLGDEIYCGYYDLFYMKCSENQNCPEENDEHDDEDNDYDIYEDY